MSDMRILYDHQIFAYQKYGGVSRYFVELASRIHRHPGTKVRIVAPLYMNKFLASQSDAVPVLGLPFTADIRGADKIMLKIDSGFFRVFSKAFRPDIVHETYYWGNRRYSPSAKIVITVYDMSEELYPEHFPRSKRTMDIRKRVFFRADHLICISENTRADLQRIYEVDPGKVSVVHLASSLAAPRDTAAALEEPYFLYVGVRKGYKNFLSLLDAFAESMLFKSFKLVCYGGGGLTAHEQERIARLGIPNDKVVCVSGEDELLSRYYASAEALVYPSLYEGFGIPLLEAMECSCPVICNNSGSIPEVAGDAAVYFDAKDAHGISNAMLKLVQSSDERRQIISRGMARAKHFSWDRCALQTYAVYAKLMEKE
jgi:glycosyltransferase involved in cell wall biosynthesis